MTDMSKEALDGQVRRLLNSCCQSCAGKSAEAADAITALRAERDAADARVEGESK